MQKEFGNLEADLDPPPEPHSTAQLWWLLITVWYRRPAATKRKQRRKSGGGRRKSGGAAASADNGPELVERPLQMGQSIVVEKPADAGASGEEGEEENKPAKECVVCYEEDAVWCVYPCGHQCVCGDCAQMLSTGGHDCPICRCAIQDVLRVWAS